MNGTVYTCITNYWFSNNNFISIIGNICNCFGNSISSIISNLNYLILLVVLKILIPVVSAIPALVSFLQENNRAMQRVSNAIVFITYILLKIPFISKVKYIKINTFGKYIGLQFYLLFIFIKKMKLGKMVVIVFP